MSSEIATGSLKEKDHTHSMTETFHTVAQQQGSVPTMLSKHAANKALRRTDIKGEDCCQGEHDTRMTNHMCLASRTNMGCHATYAHWAVIVSSSCTVHRQSKAGACHAGASYRHASESC